MLGQDIQGSTQGSIAVDGCSVGCGGSDVVVLAETPKTWVCFHQKILEVELIVWTNIKKHSCLL